MPWQQLTFRIASEHTENVSFWLNLLGVYAVTFQDAADTPIFEPDPEKTPLWPESVVTALFDQSIDLKQVLSFLKSQLGENYFSSHDIAELSDQDWERVWMKDFHPMQFGKNLWICPSTSTPPDPHAVNIILDPGLAFGTGTHPTTALCLEWLSLNPPRDQVITDYGCGSGILAIAALKLGGKEAWAIDHDPQALEATQQNASRNNIPPPSLEILSASTPFDIQADCFIANILANTLIEHAEHFAHLTKLNGHIILSGILEAQIPEVQKAYQPWFSIDSVNLLDGWALLVGNRKM